MFWLVAALTCCIALGLAWGPGTHLEFEQRVFRQRRKRLPADVAALIETHREAWQYGHIAADIINFKGVGGPYSHCHRWGIVADMRELAHSDFERAFILGYLAHLAADTIAHNHFVPYHLARYARTKGLGHLYWEMRADRFVPDERWEVVTRLKNERALLPLDQLVNRTVPKKALSLGTNKVIFNHVLLVSERRQWRAGIAALHRFANVDLKRGFLERFREAAVERIVLALGDGGIERIAHVDANGKQAQKAAVSVRTKLLQRFVAPRSLNGDESARLAAPFLGGMESPPPRR
ncbi:MAG: zinc dependent phospholipase C family protein [Planctomycetes bacterium]|nr:zinc dependent phospholipase C family protein [Planctomycetota bacterium]